MQFLNAIPILSIVAYIPLVGALAIGTVFTQLLSQNISNSTYIWLGWMELGVITFVIYRRHRGLPLWEPLEVPPAALTMFSTSWRIFFRAMSRLRSATTTMAPFAAKALFVREPRSSERPALDSV